MPHRVIKSVNAELKQGSANPKRVTFKVLVPKVRLYQIDHQGRSRKDISYELVPDAIYKASRRLVINANLDQEEEWIAMRLGTETIGISMEDFVSLEAKKKIERC
jgi:hypothetical protein